MTRIYVLRGYHYADDDDENLIGYTFDVKDIEGDRSTIQFDIMDESTLAMYETGEDGCNILYQ